MMVLSLDKLRDIIKENSLSPFTRDFIPEKLLSIISKYEKIEDQANSLIKFIGFSDSLYHHCSREILFSFDSLSISKQELTKLLFRFCNYEYSKAISIITEKIIGSHDNDMESRKFLQIEDESGNKIHATTIPEMQVDITAELLRFMTFWEPENSGQLQSLDEDELLFHLSKAWRAANVIINLRDQCLSLILHDNCYPEWINDTSVKIKRQIPAIDFIRTAANVRVSNHLVEITTNLSDLISSDETESALELISETNGTLTLKISSKKSKKSLGGLSSLLKYHAAYLHIPLKQYGELTIIDLIKIFGNLVEAFTEFLQIKTIKSKPQGLTEQPVYLDRLKLTQTLVELSGQKQQVVEKLIDSLICNSKYPYFWKAPFYEFDGQLFVALHVFTVPNFNLFIDKWIIQEAFSYDYLVKRFKEFLVLDIKRQEPLFDTQINGDVAIEGEKSIDNNILVLTKDNALLLELVIYQYPVEYEEHEKVLQHLGLCAIECHEKMKIFTEKYKDKIGQRKIMAALVTEYPIYSGLIINTIPVVDTSLLYNYFFTGEFSKDALLATEDGFRRRHVAAMKYFFDETSFNEKLNEFLMAPTPVYSILKHLKVSEIDLLPQNSNIRIVAEITDHVGPSMVMAEQTEEVGHLLKYEYYVGAGKELARELEETIYYNLSILLESLAHSSYVPQHERMDLVRATMEAKSIGHAHLIHYLLKASSTIIYEKKATKSFSSTSYDPTVMNLLERLKRHIAGGVALSEFEMPNIFTEKESKSLISMAINVFDSYAHRFLKDDDISFLMLNLLILQGFRKKYEVKNLFFAGCLNMVDLLNQSNHYQKARDFCEEMLHLCIRTHDHSYAWLLFFNCYSHQGSLNEAAFYGCLFFSSLRSSRKLSYDLFEGGIFALMKFLRNFGYSEFAMNVYHTAAKAKLKSFDNLKISAVYFYTLFKEMYRNPDSLNDLPKFLEDNVGTMRKFGTRGVGPWIGLFYNLQRLERIGLIVPSFPVQNYLDKLIPYADSDVVEEMRNKVLGTEALIKDDFVEALLRVFETRDLKDYVHEVSNLEVPAYNLIRQSIERNDPEGILLASIVLSDQTLTFKSIDVPDIKAPLVRERNENLFLKFKSYQSFFLNQIDLKQGQLLLWFFEYDKEAGYIIINSDKKIVIKKLGLWLRPKLIDWTSNISGFHFNAKNLYAIDYDLSAQETDYKSLLKEFETGDIYLDESASEILLCQSVELAAMPHNLIVSNGDFLSIQKPITNVVSLQYYSENNRDIYLPKNYQISAWIPIEDGNMTINWGFNSLEPTLKSYGATIYTQTEPGVKFNTDVNVFMAHGVREFSGFKAVKTTDDPHSTIIHPSRVFGSGCIAILFICNSGSTKDDFYSKQMISFSTELLRFGYDAVVSSFWPYDVTMANRWLVVFLESLDLNFTASEAVFKANSKLAEYDSQTSSLFFAPAGRLSMHLYGNPNIRIKPS